MLEDTLLQLRSAKNDVEVINTMKAGQTAIDDLREKASYEDFEKIVEHQKEVDEEQDEISKLISDYGITDDDVLDDVNALEALMAEDELGKVEVPSNQLGAGEEEVPKIKVHSKKKVIYN